MRPAEYVGGTRNKGKGFAMDIERKVGHAPKTSEAGQVVATLPGPCVGCADCRGLCWEFLELLTLPKAVVRET